MKKSLLYILSALALCSCAKEAAVSGSGEPESYPICFAMDNVGYSVKSPVESVDDIKTNVNIYGTLDATPIDGYQNARLSFNSTTNLWKLDSGNDANWAYETGNKNEYSFAAYSYVGDATISNLTTSGDNFGTSFNITQPAAYSHNGGKGCGTDYLLSQVFNCTTTTQNDKIQASTVQLHMEHALACVEVWLTVNSTLTSATVENVTLSGFYRTAKMQCSKKGVYGLSSNVWTTRNLTNKDGSYSVTGFTFNPSASAQANTQLLLRFCAIPQFISDATLSITLTTNSTLEPVTRSWELKNYKNWESGYRNIYTINLDTSNSLTCAIAPWDEVGDVGGTILPSK